MFHNLPNTSYGAPSESYCPSTSVETHFVPPHVGQAHPLPQHSRYSTLKDSRSLGECSVQSVLDEFSSFATASPQSLKLSISEVKILLASFNEILTSFEGIINYLQVTKKSLSDDDWNTRVVQAEQKKKDLASLYNSLDDPAFFRQIVIAVKTQKRKRAWRKKKRAQWQEQKKHIKLTAEREHRRIDLWLEKMKDEVERARRAEAIKNEGDLILANVTQNKSSAKRYLNLLNTLVKLRTARVQQAIASGKPVSVDENETFVKVIEKLKKMWIDQMKEYNLEENGLRVLLEDAQTERINVEDQLQRKTFQQWNEFFFGRDRSVKLPGEPESVEEFTAARFAWDRFIAETNDVSASSIPVGWVIPAGPSDANWASFLQDS